MGAWGTGPFENDAALDRRARHEEAGAGAIEGALRAVLRSSGRVDTDGAAEGVAAAATLAELLHAAPTGSARSEASDRTGLAPDAIAALDRIVQQCELAELWAETDELEAWASAVRGIRAQVAAVAPQ